MKKYLILTFAALAAFSVMFAQAPSGSLNRGKAKAKQGVPAPRTAEGHPADVTSGAEVRALSPAEMIERQPYLPRFTAGGPGNPLGARAMYLGKTVYRIHGTNEPEKIGQGVSSGCIRMRDIDAIDLYNRVKVGTKVVVI